MDEQMRRHIEYMEREFPRDPSKYVQPPELAEDDERLLDEAWRVTEGYGSIIEKNPDARMKNGLSF